MAPFSEETVILRGGYREFFSPGWKDVEPGEFAPEAPEGGFVADTLENLAKDEIGQTKRLPLELAVEPIGMRIHCSAEVFNPHSAVDNSQASDLFLHPPEARFFQVALPPHLAAKAAKGCLLMSLHKKAQTGLDSCPLRVRAAAAHRLMDKLIVNFDVGSHEPSYV
jgi:hypothetical protein